MGKKAAEEKRAAKKKAAEEKKAAKRKAAEDKKSAKSVKAKARAKGKAKGKEAKEEAPEIPQTVLAKADRAGMTEVLHKLLRRDDIKDASISASKALSALEDSNVLMH